MKLLISGATGFIGKNLVKRLIEKNHNVCAIVRNSTNTNPLDKDVKVFFFNDNIADLISFIRDEKIDGVIHLASLVLTTHKTEDVRGLIDSNVFLPTAILEAAIQCKTPWFINTGTIWQHYKNKKYSPVNLYAATKQAFESIAKYYTETTTINFVTVEPCDNFGPFDTRPKIFNLLLKISKDKEALSMSPGEQLLDISYIDNIIDGYMQMIKLLSKDTEKKLCGKTFVINSDKRISLKRFVELFEKISKTKLNINWGGKEYRPREVMIPWEKGVRIPGWKPLVSTENGIKKTLDALRQQITKK